MPLSPLEIVVIAAALAAFLAMAAVVGAVMGGEKIERQRRNSR